MPVPVPRQTKPIAHPVIKSNHCALGQAHQSSNVTGVLSIQPLGLPPSFGTPEEWSTSLPSWRRNKVWPSSDKVGQPTQQFQTQDFYSGLTAAGNASVIKGIRAEAPIPPMYNYLSGLSRAQHDNLGGYHEHTSQDDVYDEMAIDYNMDEAQLHDMQWELVGRDVIDAMGEDQPHTFKGHSSLDDVVTDSAIVKNRSSSSSLSPVSEDQSSASGSGPESGSSPLEPLTPFGDFVDRAVAEAKHFVADSHCAGNSVTVNYNQTNKQDGLTSYQTVTFFPSITDMPKEDSAGDTIIPTVNVPYKKLVEPLSDWVANYVWKVCTTGFSLQNIATQSSVNGSPKIMAPPSSLASSIHSVLLSTQLQPSAVFLAIWYITRLPVYFSAGPVGPGNMKEIAFRNFFLGSGVEQVVVAGNLTFRIVVLGFMLANKWLDDNTFSNKTWHSISNVPLSVLNELEARALDIFSYDLSISFQQWSQWMSHVLAYHISLSSAIYPQPISRPSSNPHALVRRGIEEIIRARHVSSTNSGVPRPVFLGLEERLKERLEKEKELDIDLDEDGPLREEYLPKRRASKLISHISQQSLETKRNWNVSEPQALPPPAKWSPSGDEPILRDRNRVSGRYVAVQAPRSGTSVWQPLDMHYNQNWNPSNPIAFNTHIPVKSQTGYMYDPLFGLNPSYDSFAHMAMPHSRSQSLSYDQDPLLSHHMRTYSQSRFEYKNERTSLPPEPRWVAAPSLQAYNWPTYIHIPAVGLQPAW